MAHELSVCANSVLRNEKEVDEEMDKLVQCFENFRHRQLWGYLAVAKSKCERIAPPADGGGQKVLDEGKHAISLMWSISDPCSLCSQSIASGASQSAGWGA
jgi:hypothetical protein